MKVYTITFKKNTPNKMSVKECLEQCCYILAVLHKYSTGKNASEMLLVITNLRQITVMHDTRGDSIQQTVKNTCSFH